MLRIVLLLLLCSLATPLSAEEPAILVLGDSLSAGHGIDVNDSWVQLLEQRLQRLGYRYHVVNASISGDTTRGGLTRTAPALTQHQPRILIVELGGNDGLRGLSLEDMRRNLANIIEQGKKSGAAVLLVGVRLPPNYGEVYVKKFHSVYRELARSYEIPLVPYLLQGIGGHDELMQVDRLHPNSAAQARMLDNVWPHLAPLLEKN